MTSADLLVVGGAMRGGTSLLHRLLNSHPQIRLMTYELRALRYADLATWTHVLAVHQSSLITRARWLDVPFRRSVYRYLAAIMRGHGLSELTTVDRIHEAMSYALAVEGTRYVGDKYPDYVLTYPQYIHRPHTRCIFVYRDARDVVASIVERTQRGDWRNLSWARRYNTVERATDYWLVVMQALDDMRRLQTNALIIRYEDLAQRKNGVIASIATHLNVPNEHFDASLAVPDSVGRYRQRLDRDQLDGIERRAGAMMEAFGYTPGRA